MIRYMLDTDICIYLIKEKDPGLRVRLREAGIGSVCLSAISMAELSYGTEKSSQVDRNRLALTLFLAPVEILPFSSAAALVYGALRQRLECRGKVIGAYDMLIGAHALAEGLTLVTNNTNEFKRIEGLKVENWVS